LVIITLLVFSYHHIIGIWLLYYWYTCILTIIPRPPFSLFFNHPQSGAITKQGYLLCGEHCMFHQPRQDQRFQQRLVHSPWARAALRQHFNGGSSNKGILTCCSKHNLQDPQFFLSACNVCIQPTSLKAPLFALLREVCCRPASLAGLGPVSLLL